MTHSCAYARAYDRWYFSYGEDWEETEAVCRNHTARFVKLHNSPKPYTQDVEEALQIVREWATINGMYRNWLMEQLNRFRKEEIENGKDSA